MLEALPEPLGRSRLGLSNHRREIQEKKEENVKITKPDYSTVMFKETRRD